MVDISSTSVGLSSEAGSGPVNVVVGQHQPAADSDTSGAGPSRSEKAARWLAEHGGTLREAGARFGVSRQATHEAWRRIFGAIPVPVKAEVDSRVATRLEQVRESAAAGRTPIEIATQLKLARDVVYRAFKQLGLDPRDANRQRVKVALDAVQLGERVFNAAQLAGLKEGYIRYLMKKQGIRRGEKSNAA